MIGVNVKLFLFPVVVFLIIIVGNCPLVGKAEGSQSKSKTISLELDKHSLGDVLKMVSQQTQTKIVVDSDWLDLPISGNYQDIDVGSFFRRILKGESILVLYDEESSEIFIRSFGSKNFVTFRNDQVADDGAIDQMSGISLLEIQELREKEAEEIREYYANPESIDQMSGMTFGEIAKLREWEAEVMQAVQEDPDAIDQMSGLKLSEINEMRENERKIAEEYESNPDAVDQMSGMRISDIKLLREREAQEIQDYYANPDSIDQMSGMTLGEIAKIREQEKNFAKN